MEHAGGAHASGAEAAQAMTSGPAHDGGGRWLGRARRRSSPAGGPGRGQAAPSRPAHLRQHGVRHAVLSMFGGRGPAGRRSGAMLAVGGGATLTLVVLGVLAASGVFSRDASGGTSALPTISADGVVSIPRLPDASSPGSFASPSG